MPNSSNDMKLHKSLSFKKCVSALRQNSIPPSITHRDENTVIDSSDSIEGSYPHIHKVFVWRALCPDELPQEAVYQLKPIETLSLQIFASSTGPSNGILTVGKWNKTSNQRNDQMYLDLWKSIENRKAHGLSVSLYEKNPVTNRHTGDPNADAFVVRARHDSAYLAVADGVNWGKESMKAARCAVYAVFNYLEMHLYDSNYKQRFQIKTTQDAAQLLFEAFSYAQEKILDHTHKGLTTLCVALVLPLAKINNDNNNNNNNNNNHSGIKGHRHQYCVIVASVGDSKAFLLSKQFGIHELTGCVPKSNLSNGADLYNNIERDFRETGGALGNVHANGKPELNNLICAVTLCNPGDLVLLGSDGLVDNFDPVITRLAVPVSPQFDFVDDDEDGDDDEGDSAEKVEMFHENVDEDGSSTQNSSINLEQDSNGVQKRNSHLCSTDSSPLTNSMHSNNNNNNNNNNNHNHNGSLLSPVRQLSLPSHLLTIWPKPPPPPGVTLTDHSDVMKQFSLDPSFPHTLQGNNGEQSSISACQINFTNKLELTWEERCYYLKKELERVWHELDINSCQDAESIRNGGTNRNGNEKSNPKDGVISSRDLCFSLIDYVQNVTKKRRDLLEDVKFMKLHNSRYESTSDQQNTNENNQSNMDQFDTPITAEHRKWFSDWVKKLPGKMDHATVVIYEIGSYHGNENECYDQF